jgi:Putative phage serine protease XkdF
MAAKSFADVLSCRVGVTGWPRQIIKAAPAHQVVFAVALESGVTDRQGDLMDDDGLIDAAIHLGENGADAGIQHERVGPDVGKVVCSFPLTADIARSLGITLPDGRGLLLVGIKIADAAVWNRVQKGDFGGVSVGGLGHREEFE